MRVAVEEGRMDEGGYYPRFSLDTIRAIKLNRLPDKLLSLRRRGSPAA
jgi:hypothetical protein